MLIKDKQQITYEVCVSKNSGEERLTCPKCSKDRKKQNLKPFSFNHSKGVGFCQHCETEFFNIENKSIYTPEISKHYVLPKELNKTQLSEKAVNWFKSRGISQKTLIDMKISEGLEWMPQVEREINTIQFNYFRDGIHVNTKYRDGAKNFKLYKDAELIAYNIDSILGAKIVYIVEGEIDCLTMIEAGFESTISVPNGASTNLTWLDSSINILENKEIVIAVDNDSKGIELKNELLRRLGTENCKIVEWDGVKDANECLVRFGVKELRDKINSSEHQKLEGTFEVIDFEKDLKKLWQEGLQKGKTIGDENVDELISFETGRFMIVTGIPNCGKSDAVDDICVKLNIHHEWKIGYFSPENSPIQLHASKLIRKLSGKSFDQTHLSEGELSSHAFYLHNNFYWVLPSENFTVDNILEKAKYLIKTKGIKVFVIDPYNRIEQGDDMKQGEILKLLVKLVNFAKQNNILLILVAHPTKMKKENGKFEIPNMYSISGSAHFFNIIDYGMTVYREEDHVQWHIQKIKFENLGRQGMAIMKRNSVSGRYFPVNSVEEEPKWNYESYLKT